MILCNICHEHKDESNFYRSKSNKSGYDHRCKPCTKKRLDKYRTPEKIRSDSKKHKQSNTKKTNARNMLAYHVARGHIYKPNTCPQCNSKSNIEAHHPNYDYPLTVLWMCSDCHRSEHGKQE